MATNNGQEIRTTLPLLLARKLEGKSPQFGKTVFVKLAYLLQEVYKVPLGYRFSLYTYGPYSSEVLADLDRARFRGQVKVDYIGEDAGFAITEGLSIGDLGSGIKPLMAYEDAIDRMVESFGHYNARNLELRTTIAYLWNMLEVSDETSADKLVDEVLQLKPQFNEVEIKKAIGEFKSGGILPYVR